MTLRHLSRPAALLLCAASVASAGVPPPLPARGRVAWSGDLTLDATVTVPAGVTLALEPGTRLRFVRAGRLLVNGSLEAAGTPRKPVRLEGSRDAEAPCIETGPSAAPLRLEHTEVRGAALGARLRGGTATLASCRFERCGVAVSLDLKGRATLEETRFEACRSGLVASNGASVSGRALHFLRNGTGLDVSNEAAADLSAASFEGNGTGVRVEKARQVAFLDCRWEGNDAGLEVRQMEQGGVVRQGVFEGNATAVTAVLFGNLDLVETRFCRNTTAVRATQSSAPRLRRCCLAANGRGLDLQKRSHADVEACRLEANDVALFADFSSYPRIVGNVFRANQWHVWLGDYQSLDWEARHGPPSSGPRGGSTARHRPPPRSAPPAGFSVAGNAWDASTLREMRAGGGANVTRFWDGRDRGPTHYPDGEDPGELYDIDAVRFLPALDARGLSRGVPEDCGCAGPVPARRAGERPAQRPRR